MKKASFSYFVVALRGNKQRDWQTDIVLLCCAGSGAPEAPEQVVNDPWMVEYVVPYVRPRKKYIERLTNISWSIRSECVSYFARRHRSECLGFDSRVEGKKKVLWLIFSIHALVRILSWNSSCFNAFNVITISGSIGSSIWVNKDLFYFGYDVGICTVVREPLGNALIPT